MEEFIPTTLGVALVQGYDDVGFEISLSKPFLRKEMELRMKDICEGRKTREEVVRDSLRQYKQVFQRTENEIGVLKAVGSLPESPTFGILRNPQCESRFLAKTNIDGRPAGSISQNLLDQQL